VKGILLVMLAAVALVAVPVAHAETAAEVRDLAARAAAGDGTALAELRRVTVVDGRRVALGRALAGADGIELASRLGILAEPGTPAAAIGDPAASAAAILDQGRFKGSNVPRPLHGVLAWLGDRLRELARPFRWLEDHLPGGATATAALLGGLVVVIAAAAALAIARRRAGVSLEHAARRRREHAGDPDRLEREADEAELRGDLEAALRLRFRAGLARLALADAIPRDERTSGELRPVLDHAAFDRLASGLDVVAYGRRAASAEDVQAARADWQQVLERAGAR
jgi:Ni/Co efflux regulator RcnB